MLKSRVKIFIVLVSLVALSGAGYALTAAFNQVQTVQHDSALTAAFVQIIPDPNAPTPTPLVPLAANVAPEKPSGEGIQFSPQSSVVDALTTPLLNEARRRRADRVKNDAAYLHRIDRALNVGRINILLFGYGETHEPPLTEKAIIGSQTILSYDLRHHTVDIVSFTHDIRAPEIERELQKRGQKTGAVRIDQAYNVGGFRLMRQTLEDATGLSIDFQITFRDAVMQGLVDNVFGGVTVDVPATFDVHPFYLDDKKYPAGHFEKGVQTLSGLQVIQFIKTVPVSAGAYDPVLEHNARKSLVLQAMVETLRQTYRDHQFWLKLSTFVGSQMISGAIVYDFDPVALIVNNIGNTTASLQRTLAQPNDEATLPRIDRSKYIVDSAHGDGGVQWVTPNAVDNPLTQKDIDAGVYKPIDFEIPLNANPYGDLVTEYWTSVRTLVRYSLNAPPSAIYNFPTP